MKIDFSTPILALDGSPIKDGETVITMDSVSANALLSTLKGDESASGQYKAQLFALAMKIHGGSIVEITPEDAVTLKERIGRSYGPLVVGRAYEIIG